jgi:glycosyltransferase involved in cell wall biosynthesis
VISCLRTAGVEVCEIHAPVWEGRRDSWRAGAGTAARILSAELSLLRRDAGDADAVIVGYPGQLDLPAARHVAGERPLIFNPLVSLADTLVSDRGRFRAGSAADRVLRRIDRAAFDAADVVVADTQAQARFFATLTRTPLEVCFVGAEERLFQPTWRQPPSFSVLFVGKLIPLHGVEVVLDAARRAPEIPFRIVGSGQLDALLAGAPPNVEHVPWLPYEQLPRALSDAGCALGLFGTSDKAHRVIPNKAFQALAVGTPLVTGDTPAARELVADAASAVLVPTGDGRALAEAVRGLAADPELARRVAAGGRRAYEREASESVLAARWRDVVERSLHSRK